MGRLKGFLGAQWQVIELQLPKQPEKGVGVYPPHAPWRGGSVGE